METRYTYTPSPDYINDLAFDYIETYSFQRGKAYEDKIKLLKPEYGRLNVRKEKNKPLLPEEELRLEELSGMLNPIQRLMNADGTFHFSAVRTHTFLYDDPGVDTLKRILRTEVKEVPHFLCAPNYRDAIVFYDNTSKVVSVLNVCLSCKYMETGKSCYLNADFETYGLLKRWFIGIGHEVENPDYFIMNEINQLKEKHSKQG